MILMLALGGPALAIGGCALFLANLNIGDGGGHGGSDNLSALGAIIFAAGCLAFLVGIIWAIARGIDRRFARAAAEKEKAGGTPPALGTSTTSTSTSSTPSTSSTSSTDTEG
jgi:hypothetical protein